MMGVEPRIREKIKVNGIRKIIGEKMRESVTNHPQGTLWNKVVMDELLELKNSLKEVDKDITVTGMIIKAVSNTLEKHPLINAGLMENEIHVYENINMGVAVEIDATLYIVVIRDTQDKDFYEISKELKELVDKLKTSRISMDDFIGATFVISNLGMYDLDGFTPIISPPLTGILGVSTAREEVIVDENRELDIKKRAEFTLTLNHASTDGAPGARFFQDLKHNIEHIKDEFVN